MSGASTAISAPGPVYPAAKHNYPHLAEGASHTSQRRADSDKSGALGAAERVVSQALGSTGFIDLKATLKDSFLRGLQSRQGRADSDKSGALAAAERVVSQALGNTGFVDFRASLKDSFVRGLQQHPEQTGMEDLKPGALQGLMSWAMSRIAMSASQALEAQASFSHAAAIKLLT